MHSEEISKQYLETIKTVKQVDSINCTRSASKGRGHGRGHGQSQHRSQSKGRPPGSGNCSNCGSSHPPKRSKVFGKECYHCHKKGHFHSTVDPSNVDVHLPNPDTTMVPGSPFVMSMT